MSPASTHLPNVNKSAFNLFPSAKENILKNLCPICSAAIEMGDFKDDLSRAEYEISGLCQSCQDSILSPEPA